MNWIYVLIAGLFEIGWIYSLKSSEGFSRFSPLMFYAVCGLGAAFFLSQALRSLPVGSTYAVWVGIAIAGSNLAGMVFFGEPYKFSRISFILLIIVGIIGLKLSSTQ